VSVFSRSNCAGSYVPRRAGALIFVSAIGLAPLVAAAATRVSGRQEKSSPRAAMILHFATAFVTRSEKCGFAPPDV
jgi:hypothetical protein